MLRKLATLGRLLRNLSLVPGIAEDLRKIEDRTARLDRVAPPIPTAPSPQAPDRHDGDCDIGRSYRDPPGTVPHITLAPGKPVPWSIASTDVTIRADGRWIRRPVYHAHLCFLKAAKDYPLGTVLDLGCGEGNEAALFGFLGAEVFTVNADPAPGFKADFFGDYMDLKAPHRFDLIWCSAILEHVRNPGAFLDKVFDDLKDGGAFAVSVPYNEFNSHPDCFSMGHHNRYNFLLLVYALICAGFDCSPPNVCMRMYNGMLSVIVRKSANALPRSNMAAYSDVTRLFPVPVDEHGGTALITELNWRAYHRGGPPIEVDRSRDWRQYAEEAAGERLAV